MMTVEFVLNHAFKKLIDITMQYQLRSRLLYAS